jgi:hypothetical protein
MLRRRHSAFVQDVQMVPVRTSAVWPWRKMIVYTAQPAIAD